MAGAMGYALDSNIECERLERQALLQGPDRVLKHIPIKPGDRVLDAGSGSGWVARGIATRFPDVEVVGVDINPKYVDFAKRRCH